MDLDFLTLVEGLPVLGAVQCQTLRHCGWVGIPVSVLGPGLRWALNRQQRLLPSGTTAAVRAFLRWRPVRCDIMHDARHFPANPDGCYQQSIAEHDVCDDALF